MCGRLDWYLHEFKATTSDEFQYNRECSLLLLAVIDQISTSQLTRNFIEINSELAKSYSHAGNKCSMDIEQHTLAIAFTALAETKFWCLSPKAESEYNRETAINSWETLRKYYWGATFTEDLFPLLIMETSRNKLSNAILSGLGQK